MTNICLIRIQFYCIHWKLYASYESERKKTLRIIPLLTLFCFVSISFLSLKSRWLLTTSTLWFGTKFTIKLWENGKNLVMYITLLKAVKVVSISSQLTWNWSPSYIPSSWMSTCLTSIPTAMPWFDLKSHRYLIYMWDTTLPQRNADCIPLMKV
jgi:hypothetical protein